jgi:DNA repair exonuclease SbcCD ATPase subunit
MLIDAQREMHKNIDNHQKRFKKQIDEFEALINQGDYWQIIYNKNELKALKRNITLTMDKYKEPEENLHRFSKLQILRNLAAYMEDFMEVLNFTIGDLEKQKDNIMEG